MLDEAPSRCEKTPGEEEESGVQVTRHAGPRPSPGQREQPREDHCLKSLVRTRRNLVSCAGVSVRPHVVMMIRTIVMAEAFPSARAHNCK